MQSISSNDINHSPRSSLYDSMDFNLFMLDEGRGWNRAYYTKSSANCLYYKMPGIFSNGISHSPCSSLYDSLDFILFMLDEDGGEDRTYYTKSGASCLVIKCNEFSQMTLATHLAHPFMTTWILICLCETRGGGGGNGTYYTKSGANYLVINAINFRK